VPYDLINRFILVFTGLFVVVDPFAAVPVIISLTADDDPSEVTRIAGRASLFGAAILLFFACFGTAVFRFLQIDLNAFRAAGGLLLLLTALGMLRNKPKSAAAGPGADAPEKDDLSVVPFATPLLSGPGAITSVVVFSTGPGAGASGYLAVLALAVVLVFLAAYWVLRSAVPIKRMLGRSGMNVVQQMMGLLLAALSLQFIAQGLVPLVKSFWVP
jgi:multiple antibiotic resistance protein